MINEYRITCTNDRFWKLDEFLEFLVQNQRLEIVLTINPEAINLKELGLYKILDLFEFKSVTIITANLFETHNRYNVICKNAFDFIMENVEIDPALHQWNKNKIFLTMYHRPIASRLGIAGHLFTHHRDISHLHFSFGNQADDLALYEIEKLVSYDPLSIVNVGTMIPHMPLEIGSSYGYSPDGRMINFESALRKEYKRILIDIVGENHVLGDTFFPTEKITRPMWLKKPFVVFASKNYLAYLRQMGFRTFGDFWDETYDGYEGRERYLRILDLIDWIAGHSYDQLETMYWDMQYTLDHNYNLVMTQGYNKTITKLS
jgi:hypothetical protein